MQKTKENQNKNLLSVFFDFVKNKGACICTLALSPIQTVHKYTYNTTPSHGQDATQG